VIIYNQEIRYSGHTSTWCNSLPISNFSKFFEFCSFYIHEGFSYIFHVY
jgi:hypothetical protein